MKSAKRVPTPTITSASAASVLAAPVPVTPIAPERQGWSAGVADLPACVSPTGIPRCCAEVHQLLLGLRIEHAAAADDERLLCAARARRPPRSSCASGACAAQTMQALVEEASG